MPMVTTPSSAGTGTTRRPLLVSGRAYWLIWYPFGRSGWTFLRSNRTAWVSTWQFRAEKPVSITSSTARRLIDGSVPGIPRQIGHTRVFGSSVAPAGGDVGHRQNIFESVRS